MTKANQVAPMLAMLRGLIPDATEAIGEFAKLAEYVDETEARATQAERDRDAWRAKWEALETTRAVCCDQMERERDEWRARCENVLDAHPDGGWQARALDAERELAALRALIHTESGLDDHRYSPEQMVEEMARRWQGASDDCERAERERDEARAERDAAVDRLVGARVARESAFEDADDLRARLAKTEKVVEAAREDAQHCPHACSPPCPFDRAVARTRAALRALDSPVGGSSVDPRPLCIRCAKPWVPLEGCDATMELCPACWYRGERPGVAGTDSEGGAPCTGQVTPGTVSGGASGAATPGGHTSAVTDASPGQVVGAAPRGPDSEPEPAGSSQPDPLAALAAVLSLPLTEEDRKRIEGVVSRLRPEQPRGGLLPEPWERRPSLDPQAPATRAELDELRRRVERLENLTGSGDGSGDGAP